MLGLLCNAGGGTERRANTLPQGHPRGCGNTARSSHQRGLSHFGPCHKQGAWMRAGSEPFVIRLDLLNPVEGALYSDNTAGVHRDALVENRKVFLVILQCRLELIGKIRYVLAYLRQPVDG